MFIFNISNTNLFPLQSKRMMNIPKMMVCLKVKVRHALVLMDFMLTPGLKSWWFMDLHKVVGGKKYFTRNLQGLKTWKFFILVMKIRNHFFKYLFSFSLYLLYFLSLHCLFFLSITPFHGKSQQVAVYVCPDLGLEAKHWEFH